MLTERKFAFLSSREVGMEVVIYVFVCLLIIIIDKNHVWHSYACTKHILTT